MGASIRCAPDSPLRRKTHFFVMRLCASGRSRVLDKNCCALETGRLLPRFRFRVCNETPIRIGIDKPIVVHIDLNVAE